MVQAGSASISPFDSPSNRVDPNTTTSPFAGVVSIRASNSAGTFLGSGCFITPRHVLTAAHLLDGNNDGIDDSNYAGFRVNINYGSNVSHVINVLGGHINPEYTGFLNPSIQDDIAVLYLEETVPAGVPIYSICRREFNVPEEVTIIGYGKSGYGDVGDTVGSSWSKKRVGRNFIDFIGPNIDDDDVEYLSPGELWYGSFTKVGEANPRFPPSIGNDIETSGNSGDSGGPIFIFEDNKYKVAGVTSFIMSPPPEFGELFGGISVYPYLDWIDETVFKLAGDVNFDGVVDIGDMGIVGSNWGKTNAEWHEGDFNRDGVVDIGDMAVIGANWGKTTDYI